MLKKKKDQDLENETSIFSNRIKFFLFSTLVDNSYLIDYECGLSELIL